MANLFQCDLHQLAVGVLYLNLGRAGLDFPTSTKGHPSYLVHVTLVPGGLLSEDHKELFPFQVRWDIWQRVVVPLFVEGSVLVKVGAEQSDTLCLWINKEYLLTGDTTALIAKIQQALLAGFEDQGYIPVGTTEEGLVASGSPVQPDGSPYTRFD